MDKPVLQKTNLEKLANEGGIFFASQCVAILIGMAKVILIARLLGPTHRGVFGLFCVIPELILGFGNLGFTPAILYFGAKKKYALKEIVGGVWVFSLVMGAILAGVGVVALQFDSLFQNENNLVRNYAFLLIASIPLSLLAQLGYDVLVCQSRVVARSLLLIVQAVLSLALFLLLIVMVKSSLTAAIVSWALVQAVMAFFPFLLLIGRGAYPPKWNGEFFKKGLTFGFAGYFSQCFQMALLKVDYLFIAVMLGPTALGFYVIAKRLAELLLLLPDSFLLPFVPLLFGMRKEESDRFTAVVVKLVFAVMALACAVLGLVGMPILTLMFGDEFAPAYYPLLWLLPGVVSMAVYPFLRYDLFGRNLPAQVSFMTGVALVVNVVLNYLTIPHWGLIGAAFSSSAAYTVATLLLLAMYCRASRTSFLGSFTLNAAEFRSLRTGLARKLGALRLRVRTEAE